MKRILILGASGSGKSTLSFQLEEKMQITCFHLDQLYWKAGWIPAQKDEYNKKNKEIIENNDSWIIEGNYPSSLDLRLPYADTVIYLDFPKYIYFPRIFKRIFFSYGKTTEAMPDDCPESVDWNFISDVWNYEKTSKYKVDDAIEKYRNSLRVVTLYHQKDVQNFLTSLST